MSFARKLGSRAPLGKTWSSDRFHVLGPWCSPGESLFSLAFPNSCAVSSRSSLALPPTSAPSLPARAHTHRCQMRACDACTQHKSIHECHRPEERPNSIRFSVRRCSPHALPLPQPICPRCVSTTSTGQLSPSRCARVASPLLPGAFLA